MSVNPKLTIPSPIPKAQEQKFEAKHSIATVERWGGDITYWSNGEVGRRCKIKRCVLKKRRRGLCGTQTMRAAQKTFELAGVARHVYFLRGCIGILEKGNGNYYIGIIFGLYFSPSQGYSTLVKMLLLSHFVTGSHPIGFTSNSP